MPNFSSDNFKLHKRLEEDSALITELDLCLVLLINDANYPWTILVPKRANSTDIYKLEQKDQIQLLQESNALSNAMESAFMPDKLNVAAIGNVVPQLHVHHIARYKTDIAWPSPVWGFAKAMPYDSAELERTISLLSNALHA